MGQTFPKFQQFCIPSINPSNSTSHDPKQILSKDFEWPTFEWFKCLLELYNLEQEDLLKNLIVIWDREDLSEV